MKISLIFCAIFLHFYCHCHDNTDFLPTLSFTSQASIDSYFLAYEDITTLEGEINIYNPIGTRDPITSLEAFGNIKAIKGRLTLSDLESLTDLSGFSNLDSIYEQLIVRGNVGFKDFSGFTSLQYARTIFIDEVDGLTSFMGLENITEIPTWLVIRNSSIDSLEGLQNVTSIGSISFINEMGLNISNFHGLRGLERVENRFAIIGSQNILNRVKFDGIENLKFIGGDVIIENVQFAEDLRFLSGLTKINGDLLLTNLYNLSLEGLNNIDSIFGKLGILFNSAIQDFSHLQELQYIGGDFEVTALSALESFEGLDNLNTVKGNLFIGSNDLLENISSLSNIDHEELTRVSIRKNPKLEICSINSICNYLKTGKPLFVVENSVGCVSFEDVVAECSSIELAKIHVRLDLNENGQVDPEDPFYRDALITVSPSNSLFNPNSQNDGTIIVEAGTNYEFTFKETNNPFWQVSDISKTQSITPQAGVIDTLVFILTPLSNNSDVDVDLYVPVIRCQARSTINIQVKNTGTTSIGGTLWFSSPDSTSKIEFIDMPDENHNPFVVGWQFSDLHPGQHFRRTLIDTIGFGEIGTGLRYESWASYEDINGIHSDTTSHFSIIRCAYDPNDMQVTPNRESQHVENSESLKYTIRFQNIGNAEAIDVRVRDALNSNLDFSTFQFISSSHENYLSTTIDSNDVLHFDFININLIDSMTSPELSQGYIRFSISTLDSVAIGKEISNTAAIVFDRNPPIVTNTVKSAIVESLQYSTEIVNCSDGIDNDQDGLIDCFDIDCINDLVCESSVPDDTSSINNVLDLYVYLEGAYDSAGMSSSLYDNGYLPTLTSQTFITHDVKDSAYLDLPWLSGLDLESQEINSAIVDFVLISARTSVNHESQICEFIGQLRTDGSIDMQDGDCELDISKAYYFVIQHRNHLPVMTHDSVVYDGVRFKYDFRERDSYKSLFSFGQKKLSVGVYAMYAGNTSQSSSVTARADINTGDLSMLLSQFGQNSGYLRMDTDLNGDVNVVDIASVLKNNGIFSDVRFNFPE